ncbi:sucrase-isomaltase, intestinal-like [Mizuhopecten yessoensis]|uniref:alpha-glucosidase n=1 Tax=Mizuhopecten yessoensis TaxID=6573 RepID=A0A210PNL2_MIZYE|nr:sucrase-isomaltase, intestinal-like [Mizuhopecten yessoensis]OWF38082.1 Sucrase-isomaltase, intestinal [Mizuhopecten yessoensis]
MVDCSKKRVAIIAVVVIVLAAIITPIAYFVTKEDKRKKVDTPAVVPPVAHAPRRLADRINCIPESDGNVVTITQDLCESRYCDFIPATTAWNAACVFPARKEYGFSVNGSVQITIMGWKVYLKQKGMHAFNSTPFRRPYFEVQMPDENLIRFKFDDENGNRFHVPFNLEIPDKQPSKMAYELKITDKENFAFQITRKSSGAVLFNTSIGGLTLTNQFLQLSTTLPSENVYGFGENIHESFRHDLNYRSWPMFSRDQPPFHKKKSNLYGVHPFYTCVEADGNTHGVLLLNSNAQDYSFTPLPTLTYRTIGGILDFYMFLGPSPENVVQQYTQAIGRPFMPPYWSLGFQLCRYGYNSLENMIAAVNRTRDYGIPHDVQYADIDHMNNSKDFTVNNVDFAGLNDSFTALRNGGMRTVIMLDPCFVSNVSGYEPYDRLSQIRGGVMWHGGVENDTKDVTGAILGYVWPNGKVVFPDFFKNSTRQLWKSLVKEHRKRLIFDGLWIDMNEPANFGTNQDRPFNWNENVKPHWSLKCPRSQYDDPPYRTMAAYVHDGDDYKDAAARLSNKTLCMVATQGDTDDLLHYNVHSLFGWRQSPPTISALREASGERSMVLSRNTFPGSGKYVGHWLGDNDSAWPGLASSIIGMLEFNLFGIPYIGADICGFFGDTTVELCKRWMQLGAFYPFSRNHNTIDSTVEQDPGALGVEVATAAREALETRYWLLPYLYTLFHNAHVHGSTVVRPVHHEFPMDDVALGIDRQFLWGKSLLISPILEQGQTELTYYVPEGRWYDFYKPGIFVEGPHLNKVAVDSNSPISLHVRGGSILPMQEPARNTTYSRLNAMKLLVALDRPDEEGGSATGELFWDDGASIDTYENGNYTLTQFRAENQTLSMYISEGQREWANSLVLDTVQVFGVTTHVHNILIQTSNKYHSNFTYDATQKVLDIRNLKLPLNTDFKLTWHDGTNRIDCYPERLGGQLEATEERCSKRKCLFHPTDSDAPDCYFPPDYGYTAGDEMQTATGWTVNLTWKGKAPFPNPISKVTFAVEMLDNAILRFKLYDPSNSRYEVPMKMNIPTPVRRPADPRYDIIMTSKNPFHFQVKRKSTGTILWDTSVGGLTFEDQFLQIASRLPSRNVYGFGENVHTTLKHDLDWTMWPMFARDQPPGSGKNPRDAKNLYGVHPFYTCMEEDGHSHGVLLLNSNSQDYAFTPLPMLIYRTIGGILDFYMFLGPEPENVIQQYTGAIGRPMMPPYWALGFQLCRYGYNNISNLQAAVERTVSAKIPFDVQYGDIDHMEERKDFTIDRGNFSGLKEYFNELRDNGMRTIIILDPCLLADKTYAPYQKMSEQDGLIKWPMSYTVPNGSSDENGALLGYVWPSGKVVFPDFFKNSTRDVWIGLITNHSTEISFDGLWIDMNEPANFGTNEERPWNWPANTTAWSLKCKVGDTYEDPPYRSMAAFQSDDGNRLHRISEKTICMVARQGKDNSYLHYDVHSLYGWSQSKPTLDGLQMAQSGKRGLVISRSTFPGSGQYAGHWLGDNSADWDHLRLSIIGILEFNLFGIPYIGADICGFFGEPSAELCKRWMQLGAFYTFSRNHNTLGQPDQDPAVFSESVTKASREAMETRYWLLPYLYTLFHHTHIRGNTVIRPLHHEFPTDSATYGIDRQFLWGPALLISPILEEGLTEVRVYLPHGTWYDFYTGATFEGKQHITVEVNQDSKIPLHTRGGYVIPMQAPANTTVYSRKNAFSITVALASDGKRTSAEGDIYFDDGESIDSYESGNYGTAKFIASERGLKMRVGHTYSSTEEAFIIGEICVLGIRENITMVYINSSLQHLDIHHYKTNNTLVISNLSLSLTEEFYIEWLTERKLERDELERINCYPDMDDTFSTKNKEECRLRGCIWQDASHKNIPPCHINKTQHGYFQSKLEVLSNYFDGIVLEWKNQTQFFGGNIPYVELQVHNISENILRLKYMDLAYRRYEVPVQLNTTISRQKQDNDYRVEFSENSHGSFFVRVIRQSTNTTIWDTSLGGFTFAEQFLQMVVKLPSKNMYGFGENRHFSFQHDFEFKRWPMFSRDNGVNWGDFANLYGVHPFYLNIEDFSGNSHGVLLLNSNAMEIELNPLPSLTYRTIGGILDFYIFLGPTPEQVIQQYTSVIGHPYLPPYWSLGFQLCRYGYNSLQAMKEAVDRTKSADIPQDVQYADIDHMDERRDFTVDDVNFGGLQKYFKELQNEGMHTIIILDPALITNVTDYLPYNEGVKKDIFIKWPNVDSSPDYQEFNRTDMLGYVWPQGKVVFPDFLNPATRDYWRDLIVNHHKNLSFDGLWIDMNEPANFGTNEEHPWNWDENSKPYWSLNCPTSRWDDPPYKPKAIFGSRLSDKTLCMVAVQNEARHMHYDVHSLYGWSQTEPTLHALREATSERGIVISRSTYPSSGRYAGHWLGDNDSAWSDLHDSVIGLLEFNLFGIPYIGADICGFFKNSTSELCERWMQLGAFYTFSRNHNTINTAPQDPAYFGPAVASSSRKALIVRYTLLPYLYTLFYHVHVHGGTVIKSLTHNFPNDQTTWSVDTQFMWGKAFMIAPVLQQGKTQVDVYFPVGRWFDYYTGQEVKSSSSFEVVSAPRDVIPLFVYGGHILPTQLAANTTVYSRRNPMGLFVVLNENETAKGDLFWDDGKSIDTVENHEYFLLSFSFKSNNLSMTVDQKPLNTDDFANNLIIKNVTIYGKTVWNSVKVNNASHDDFISDTRLNVFRVTNLNLAIKNDFLISFL